jgi:polysaccharide biosynthesis protein PslH
MRLLALSAWWPAPADNGSRIRIANLLHALAQQHEVHFVALSQEPVQDDQRAALARVCASVCHVPQQARAPRRADVLASLWQPTPASVRAAWNPRFAECVRARAAEVNPDLIVVFELAVAPYAMGIAGIPRVLDGLEIAPTLEQFSSQPPGLRRLRSWLTWSKYRSYVTRLLHEFDSCTVASAAELRHVSALAPRIKLALIPNGADIGGYDGAWGAPDPDTIVYPGALSFNANFDAMAHFLSAIFPHIRMARPSVRLLITGKADPQQRAALPAAEGLEFTGYLPDVRPTIARSWCEVVPLRIGGGTRLKVLEALALGTPVIATPKGIEGLQIEPGRDLLVADTDTGFAQATVRLLGDAALRERLAAAGRQVVQQHYDWRVIGREFADLVGQAAQAMQAQPERAHV